MGSSIWGGEVWLAQALVGSAPLRLACPCQAVLRQAEVRVHFFLLGFRLSAPCLRYWVLRGAL